MATRRTQAERSASTRSAILDATVSCLVDLGYSGTTATEVSRRAGVSMGALVHHYPSKADLLAGGVAHVLALRQAEFRKAMTSVAEGADLLDAAIDQLWTAMSGPAFVAWVELWVAARTDPDLAAAVLEVEAEFHRSSDAIFTELFPATDYPDAEFLAQGMHFAFAVMDGVALRRLVVRDADIAPIHTLKDISRQLVGRRDDSRGER